MTAVVVSYNTCDKLRRCLACLRDLHEVIVVDNASRDGSPEMVRAEFPQVRLVAHDRNLGFGAANNVGMRLATGDAILLLNSDAYAEAGAVETLAQALTEGTAAAGGRLLNPDGSLQWSSANRLTLWGVFCEQTLLEKAFPRSRWLSPYWNTLWAVEQTPPVPVAQVMGACLMLRAPAAEFFDERFFLYCEDTELCRRLARHGRIVYEPRASFVHDLGSSSWDRRWLAVARYNRGKELYFEIHHGRWAAAVCWLLDRAGALGRWLVFGLLGLASAGARQKASLFWRVLSAPIQGPPRP